MFANRHAPNSSKFLRLIGGFVLLATLCRVWFGAFDLGTRVQAQIPDAGAQRLHLLEAVEKSNRILSRIERALTSGVIKVECVDADKKSATKRRTATGR